MINCGICNKQITKRTDYVIVEARTSPFPGVVDSERKHYCGKCWGLLNMDKRVADLIAKQEA